MRCWIIISLLCGVVTEARAQAPQLAFRDEFGQAQLTSGWQVLNENAANHSLTTRPGFLRILTERGALEEDNDVDNVFLREFTGDFILETRISFDPRAGQQFAGLVVYESQTNAAALGLTYVSGDRGAFRGLALVSAALTAQNIQPPVQRYDESNVDNPAVVTLRLLRTGEQLVAGYSQNGTTFTDFGSIVNAFPETVLVGLAATNGDYEECGTVCDNGIPADFDYFQITTLDGGGNGDVHLTELAVDGPSVVTGGESANFQATATFSDDSTLDVTSQAQWLLAPPGNGQMTGNSFQAALVPSARFVTIVATYSDDSQTHTAATLVEVVPTGTGGSGACGSGILFILPICFLSIVALRLRY